jgi:hypothetical protein
VDTGEGSFKPMNEETARLLMEQRLKGEGELLRNIRKQYPNAGGIFTEGEVLEIKGSRFEVSKIIQNGLKLRLLPREGGD